MKNLLESFKQWIKRKDPKDQYALKLITQRRRSPCEV